ncbi:uncharacterized protein LOC127281145 [Leptopilina boulardi]|uniref:uncharacterized protein LOC127281145 n=1 Tax=Leptopilina boulardi TaxID=63433 RepID=UPI0021F53B6D|nr:uncharacterized protein LOC127281145 [Leptopilina boulardi]
MEPQQEARDNNKEDKIHEVKTLLQEVVEVKNLNFSNQESCGDWNNVSKWNEKSFLSENEELKTTWRSRNIYNSIPKTKFRAYWQDRFSDSKNLNFDSSLMKIGETNFLSNFRDFLATYQESTGTPSTEYSFVSLIKVLGEATGKSLLALIYIIVNTAPVIEIFLYILRFILDKLISIRAAEDYRQIFIKSIILLIQFLSIYICLAFIFGFILIPIVQIVFNIMTRVMLFDR